MQAAPDIFEDSWFRCIATVGFVVNRHAQEIFVETDEEQSRSWLSAIETIEAECVSAQKKGVQAGDRDYLVKRTKDQLIYTAGTFTEEDPKLAKVLRLLADDIRPLTDQEIMDEFEALGKRGREIARECADAWGGRRAEARLKIMPTASLEFVDYDPAGVKTIVPTWTDTDNLLIYLNLGGGSRPLLSILCLQFYFFHEAFSHLYPNWEDTAGKLSEGYLFQIARWWYLKSEEVPITSALFEFDWTHHWKNQNLKQDADYWTLFHTRSDWFESQATRARFAWLMLEVAAFSGHHKETFKVRFMAFLDRLYKHRDKTGLGILFNPTTERIEDIYKQLREYFQADLPSKYKKILGLKSST